jgi:predicted ArsR family transcriptional regulator
MTNKVAVSPEQLKLMSSAPRQEIIAVLANDADMSARELAARLGRPVTGLYRHLDLLVSGDLIRQSGERPGPKRPEALYALTSPVFSSDSISETEAGRLAVAEAAVRYAAGAGRKFRQGVKAGVARIGKADANTRLQVTDLQLDAQGLAEFNRLLSAFVVAARKLRVPNARAADTVRMTILVSPTRAEIPDEQLAITP